MGELRIRLFGAPEVALNGMPVGFDTRKAIALLAYLAVTGRPHRREKLAALLWPESDQTRARAALRRTLSVAGAVGAALQIQRGEVALDPAAVWCDVPEFERLADSNDRDDLRAAAALAPDSFLAGFTLRDSAEFDDWVATTADRLHDQLAGVLARLAAAECGEGRWEAGLEAARRWVAIDPLSESAHREVMRLLAWNGQRPAALRQYRVCVRTLDRELGVTPLPETTALYDDIRANRLLPPDLDLVASPSSDEATLSSTEAADNSAIEVAPRTGGHPLVGRESELAALDTAWREAADTGSAAAVIGSLGLGRTTLATAFSDTVTALGGAALLIRGHAAESDLAFAGMVDLTRSLTARNPSLAEQLAPIGQPIETPGELIRMFDTIRGAVASALAGPVPGLLVVDDAHWLDPTSSDLLGYLMRRPPLGVLMLATWPSDAPATAARAETSHIVTLRPWDQDHVAAALELFALSGADAGEVWRRTGGVPRLVVEYALATQPGGSAPSAELRDLVAARLDAAPPETRQLLGTAAVLGSVADPELLRQTSGRDEVEVVDAIEDAVKRGLLVEDTQRSGYDVPYDALREWVLERVSLARFRLLHGRAADALVRRHHVDPHSVPAARVARHLAASGRDDEARDWYWKAAVTSRHLYAHREALEHLRSALALGYDPAAAHSATGDALTRLGRYDDALVAYEQAAAAVATQDDVALAIVEHKLAEVHDRLGDWVVAQAHLESSAELLEPEGTLPMRAQVNADLALVLHRQQRPEAQEIGQRALALAESSADEVALAQAHNVLGVLATGRGDNAAAAQHLQISLERSRESSNTGLAVAALNNLSRLDAQSGRIDEALVTAHEALELGVQHGDTHRIAALHDHLADLLHQAGRDAEAMEQLKAAATTFADVDDARVRPEVWKLVAW